MFILYVFDMSLFIRYFILLRSWKKSFLNINKIMNLSYYFPIYELITYDDIISA